MADDTFGDVTGNIDDDAVVIEFNEYEAVALESYEVRRSIFTQPSTFSIRLGWGGVTKELLAVLPPLLQVRLRINGCLQQTAVIDDIEAEDSVGATEINISGRDVLSFLHDACIESEIALKDESYQSLVEKALNAVLGEGSYTLTTSNEAGRKLSSGIGVRQTAPGADPAENTTGPTDKILKANLGERWYDFVKRQLDRAGLFLWASGDGSYVLSEPNITQDPSYRILRRRGQTRSEVNVKRARFRNATSQRFSEAIICGRGPGKKSGRAQVQGAFVDEEMFDIGMRRPLVKRDSNITNKEQAEFYARRKLAEARRVGWNLNYTVAGHTIPSLAGGARAVWTPDTIVEVDDDEYGIKGKYYLESVTYRRNPQTETDLVLVRPNDMIFGTDA